MGLLRASLCSMVLASFVPAAGAGCDDLPGDVAPGRAELRSGVPTWIPEPDGLVTVADVVLLLRAAVGLDVLADEHPGCGLIPGDMTPPAIGTGDTTIWLAAGDGRVDIADVVAALGMSAGRNEMVRRPGALSLRARSGPAAGIDAMRVTIVAVRLHSVSTGAWIEASLQVQDLDLLHLEDSLAGILATAVVPPGEYNQIRLDFAADATVTIDGVEHPLEVPSAVQSGFKLHGNFDVQAGRATTLLLDFVPEESLERTGNGGYMLHPEARIIGAEPPTPTRDAAIEEVATAWIGPEGGTLTLTDGAVLTVPPGALSEEHYLALTRVAGGNALTATYLLTPSGLEFDVPSTIRLPVDPAAVAPYGIDANDMTILSDDVILPSVAVGPYLLEAPLEHFCFIFGDNSGEVCRAESGMTLCRVTEDHPWPRRNNRYLTLRMPASTVGDAEVVAEPLAGSDADACPGGVPCLRYHDIQRLRTRGSRSELPTVVVNGTFADHNCKALGIGCLGNPVNTVHEERLTLTGAYTSVDCISPGGLPQAQFALDRSSGIFDIDALRAPGRADVQPCLGCWDELDDPEACSAGYPVAARIDMAVGSPLVILWDGVVTSRCRACEGIPSTERGSAQPVTVIGIDDDAGGLVLLVSQPRVSEGPFDNGLDLVEAAEEMQHLGAERALLMDGGHSSALMLGDDYLNPYLFLSPQWVAYADETCIANCGPRLPHAIAFYRDRPPELPAACGDNLPLLDMPFPAHAYYPISQGNHGSFSHSYLSTNFAIDIAAPGGDPVAAPFAGMLHVVPSSAYGPYQVIIENGGDRFVRVGHMSALDPAFAGATASAGRPVELGDIIGAVGQEGIATGNHVHLDVLTGDSSTWANGGTSIGFVLRAIDHGPGGIDATASTIESLCSADGELEESVLAPGADRSTWVVLESVNGLP